MKQSAEVRKICNLIIRIIQNHKMKATYEDELRVQDFIIKAIRLVRDGKINKLVNMEKQNDS